MCFESVIFIPSNNLHYVVKTFSNFQVRGNGTKEKNFLKQIKSFNFLLLNVIFASI